MIPTLAITAILLYVLWDRRVERREWEHERRLLLTRIQAPHTITPEIPDDAPTPEAVNPESDEDYWAARNLTVEGAPLNGGSG